MRKAARSGITDRLKEGKGLKAAGKIMAGGIKMKIVGESMIDGNRGDGDYRAKEYWMNRKRLLQ